MTDPAVDTGRRSPADVVVGLALIVVGLFIAAHLGGYDSQIASLLGADTRQENLRPFWGNDAVSRFFAGIGGTVQDYVEGHFGASSFGGFGPLIPALPFWLLGLRQILR